MIVAVAITLRRHITLRPRRWRSSKMPGRILLPVLLLNLRLHRLGKCGDRQSRLALARHAGQSYAAPSNFDCAFRTREHQALALFAAVHKVHTQAQVESLGIVEQSQHHVQCITAVIPVPQCSGGHALGRPARAGYEVRPAEEVDKEVSGHTASISLPLAPLEEMFRIE